MVEVSPNSRIEPQNLNGFKINRVIVVSRGEPFCQVDMFIAGWHPELKEIDPLCKFTVTDTNHHETQIRVVRLAEELR